jgi:hypothetical protein
MAVNGRLNISNGPQQLFTSPLKPSADPSRQFVEYLSQGWVALSGSRLEGHRHHAFAQADAVRRQ